MNTLITLSRTLLVVAFAGGLTFVVAYHITARWWRSEIGRNMMAFAAAETLTLGAGVWALAFGDSPARRLISLAAFGLFTITSWWRAVTLLRAQVRKRAAQPDPAPEPAED